MDYKKALASLQALVVMSRNYKELDHLTANKFHQAAYLYSLYIENVSSNKMDRAQYYVNWINDLNLNIQVYTFNEPINVEPQ